MVETEREKQIIKGTAGVNEVERIHACWLCSVPGIGGRTIQKLLTLCPGMQEIYRAGERLWCQVLTGRQMEQMQSYARAITPEVLWESMLAKKIDFIMLSDENYPQRLREIPDPPYGLFVKGRLPEDNCLSVAVIGARDCSEYGSFVANGIGERLGGYGVQVISGMARGIDGISQAAALKAGGTSFSVLGCGVDVCYPASNRELYESLCERGGILSTCPPGTEARPQNFPPRNRIVSGLADALIVVEARDKSGTLITVDMALEQGRDVYVVPGRVTDRLSDGCNRLIQQGAGVFLTPEDFLRELEERRLPFAGGRPQADRASYIEGRLQTEKSSSHLTSAQQELCKALDWQPMSLEQIQARISREYTVPELMVQLMGLCLERVAIQVSPGQFALRAE